MSGLHVLQYMYIVFIVLDLVLFSIHFGACIFIVRGFLTNDSCCLFDCLCAFARVSIEIASVSSAGVPTHDLPA